MKMNLTINVNPLWSKTRSTGIVLRLKKRPATIALIVDRNCSFCRLNLLIMLIITLFCNTCLPLMLKRQSLSLKVLQSFCYCIHTQYGIHNKYVKTKSQNAKKGYFKSDSTMVTYWTKHDRNVHRSCTRRHGLKSIVQDVW